MIFRILFLAFVITLMSCRSGDIPCPEIKFDKVKKSNPFSLRFRKQPRDETTASAQTAQQYSYLRAKQEERKTVDIEEWDCPQPGSAKYQKMIKEHRKKIEKQYRHEMKRKKDIDPSESVLPLPAENK
jgi:hypothetical protein